MGRLFYIFIFCGFLLCCGNGCSWRRFVENVKRDMVEDLAEEHREFDILHYDLDVSLQPKNATLKANATMAIRARTAKLKRIRLILNAGSTVASVKRDGMPCPFRRGEDYRDELLYADLDPALRDGETTKVEIAYSGSFRVGQSESIGRRSQFGVTRDAVFLSASERWFPMKFADEFPCRLSVEAPKELVVISSLQPHLLGKRVFETDRVNCSDVAVALGAYKMKTTGRITCHYLNHKKADVMTHVASEIVELFDARFGKRLEKATLVEIPDVFRSGNVGGMMTGKGMIAMPFDSSLAHSTLPHELAHCYFSTSESPFASMEFPWLAEAVAVYSELLYTQSRDGDAAMEARLGRLASLYMNAQPKMQPLGEQALTEASHLNMLLGNPNGQLVYLKGPIVLHHLRQRMGDDAFFSALRDVAKDPDLLEDAAFKKLCETKAGKDLTAFWLTWIRGAGVPQLRVQTEIARTGRTWSLSGRIGQRTQPQLSQAALRIWDGKAWQKKSLELGEGSTTFDFSLAYQPRFASVADVPVYRSLADDEEFLSELASPVLFVYDDAGGSSHRALAKGIRLFFKMPQLQKNVIALSRLKTDDLKGHDVVWMIGPKSCGRIAGAPVVGEVDGDDFRVSAVDGAAVGAKRVILVWDPETLLRIVQSKEVPDLLNTSCKQLIKRKSFHAVFGIRSTPGRTISVTVGEESKAKRVVLRSWR